MNDFTVHPIGDGDVDVEFNHKKSKPKLPTEYLMDPVKFTSMCWPHLTLYPKQQEILYSIRDNIQTFVHAGNELGKDFISGIAVPHFFASRRPCKVITSSSGETQLKSVLWGEIKERLATSKFEFPFRVSTLQIRRIMENGEEEPLSYVLGHVTKSVENFQGHHLPHDIPRVLALFDEASGIGDEYWEAAQSWFHRALVIGNPLNTTNFFFRECKAGDAPDPAAPPGSKRLLRKVIHIGGKHSPNVQVGMALAAKGYKGEKGWPIIIPGVLAYDEYLRRQIQWDKIKQQMRLHGHFYEGAEVLLYPPDWLDFCEAKYKAIYPDGYDDENGCGKFRGVAMGVDGAAGRDLTVLTVVNKRGIMKQLALPTPDTMQICSLIVAFMERYNIPDRMVAIDVGGGGKQIADRLRQMGYNIRTIAFGGAPTPPKEKKVKRTKDKVDVDETRQTYKNRRCEMYGILRNHMNPAMNPMGFAIPEELSELRKELAVHPLWYDDMGRMYLPAKDVQPHRKGKETDEVTIKKLLGHSPDRADSLVLAVFAMLRPLTKRKIGAV